MSRTNCLECCIFYMPCENPQDDNNLPFCYFNAKDIRECDKNCFGFVDKYRALDTLAYAIKKGILQTEVIEEDEERLS